LRLVAPKSLVLFFATALLAAVAALMLADLEWRRRLAIESAESRAANRALIAAEYVRGQFALVDTALRQLVIHGRRVGGLLPSDDWTDMLEAAQASLPGSGSVSVTDAKGIIRYSTLPAIVGHARRDNYIFKYLSSNDVEAMVVDAPFRSPLQQGRIVIPVGRRLSTRDGRFEGLVVAVMIPEDFSEFFRTVSYGRFGIAWAFHPTGMILVREPSTPSRNGESPAEYPLLRAAAAADSGVLHGPVEPRGPSFITAFRRLSSPPLTVAVSMSEAELLEDWRAQRRTSAVALAGLALTVSVFVGLLFRQMNALGAAVEREREARQHAEVASRLKDEFLMTLSHELRTPLNAIAGWVKMLRTGALPPESRERALETIERNAQSQTRLVEELLDVSRAISGKLQIDARAVNPADPALAAVETLRPAIIARQLKFKADVDRTLDPVMADPDRLQQIVWNLLSNAIKFTPAGGVIDLHVGRAGTNVEIVVRDNGPGITPEFLPFVFDRFRQADGGPRREQGGLGLGLAIVRHLVELHGGTVTADSEELGKGSTFRVLLPATRASGRT
jgi:signal transduction histidine kinase